MKERQEGNTGGKGAEEEQGSFIVSTRASRPDDEQTVVADLVVLLVPGTGQNKTGVGRRPRASPEMGKGVARAAAPIFTLGAPCRRHRTTSSEGSAAHHAPTREPNSWTTRR